MRIDRGANATIAGQVLNGSDTLFPLYLLIFLVFRAAGGANLDRSPSFILTTFSCEISGQRGTASCDAQVWCVLIWSIQPGVYWLGRRACRCSHPKLCDRCTARWFTNRRCGIRSKGRPAWQLRIRRHRPGRYHPSLWTETRQREETMQTRCEHKQVRESCPDPSQG